MSNFAIETNELSRHAKGGTEMMLEGLMARLDPELAAHFQIIPSRARALDPDRKRIFWLHDTPSEEEAKFLEQQANLDLFHGLVCVSHYQACLYNLIPRVPYAKMVVLQNAILPFGPYRPREHGKIKLIYHTTPHRGLEILVPVFEYLATLYPQLELDVFSSFGIYGWAQRDQPYQYLFDRCGAHPRIRYHGAVPNEIVRAALLEADIFAYPNIWPETSCLAAIEALSAGCLVVCPAYGALPETCANFATLYPFHEDKQTHANRFVPLLVQAIDRVIAGGADFGAAQTAQADYFNRNYSWDRRIAEWESYLRGILAG